MAKGNQAKLQTLLDNLVAVTLVNEPIDVGTVYMALYSTNPGDSDTGVEVNYTGYTRQIVEFGTPLITGTLAEIKNTNKIEFPTVQSDSGSFSYVGLRTALTGGILIYHGALNAIYSLNQGVKPTIPIGILSVFEN